LLHRCRLKRQNGDARQRAGCCRSGGTQPEHRQIASLRQRDLERRARALAVVVAIEPLAQPARFDTHDGVYLRIVGTRGSAEEIDRERDLTQGRKAPGKLAIDQVAEELLMLVRMPECDALADPIQLGRERFPRDAIVVVHGSPALDRR